MLLGAQIPDPSRFGIDIIFPAAMVGLAVGLITGRRELVAAIVGAAIAVVVALGSSPAIGIIAGGVIGPMVGLLVPAAVAHETAPLGTEASAGLYAMPGTHFVPADDHADHPPSAAAEGTDDTPAGGPVSTNLVLLAVLMFAVTYPSRALGLLAPGLDRLPKVVFDYLQLVGPAVLAALAAVGVMVVVSDDSAPTFHVGVEWVARLRLPRRSSPGARTCSSAWSRRSRRHRRAGAPGLG